MFNFGVTTLVLTKFSVDREATDTPAIEVAGRASGFMAWLLTQMKLNTLTTLTLQGDEVSLVEGSLSGETHTVIPISAVESTKCGYSKNLLLLYLGIILLLIGLSSGEFAPFLGLAIVAAVFFALYYFSNRVFISISAGGETAMIAFKKGLIEGEQVDLERTLQAIAVINENVLARTGTQAP